MQRLVENYIPVFQYPLTATFLFRFRDLLSCIEIGSDMSLLVKFMPTADRYNQLHGFHRTETFEKNRYSEFIRSSLECICVAFMGEIRGIVAEKTEEEFRRLAMKKFGYGKGSLSKALEVALRQWIESTDSKESDLNAC